MMQLRWYQQEACDATWQALTSGKGNPLIDLPTGSGKSLVLAELARKAVVDYAGRVVIVGHRKELLVQNAAKLAALCDIKTGIYSAGLSSRDVEQPIIVGGIQSIYNKAHELGRRHLVLIDECHLLSNNDDGMYRTFLTDLERYNPKLKIVGLTATPYRLDSGKLWGPGELFSHVCYRADVRRLIEEGFLSNLINKPSSTQYDTSGLHTRAGEFVGREVMDLFGDDHLMRQACTELVAKTRDRKSIIVFCSGVEHAELVAEILSEMTGERVDVVTGETPKLIREETLDTFGHGGFRFLCNVDVLCLDEQTEILCRDGWCSIDEMNEDKLVASWHFDGSITFDKPKAIVRRPVMKGEVFAALKTNAVDIRVTSNHRMIVGCKQQGKKWEMKQARELFGKRITMPAHGNANPEVLAAACIKPEEKKRQSRIRSLAYVYKKRYSISNVEAKLMAEKETKRKESISKKTPSELSQDECMLIGFWIGDGTKSCGRVAISQSTAYSDNVAFIDGLLSRIGIDHSRKKYKPATNTTHESVRWTLARGTGSCDQKRSGYYPIEDYLDKDGSDLFWGLSAKQFNAVLYGWWLADGLHHSKRQLTIVACSNKKLINKMQAIATCRGLRTSVRACSPPRSEKHSQQWVMSWCTARVISVAKNTFKPEQPKPNERAWCVTSLTGNIVTRRNGRVAVVGNTTGFDSPRIDCVAIMRATQSAGLFCQMVGRGLRTFPGKADALIVDFGGNLKRHGPIDAVEFGRQSSKGEGTGEAPTKFCPSCEEQVAAGTRICGCGFAFTFRKAEHEQVADEESKVLSEPETMDVAFWTLSRHKKKDKPDAPNTLRVTYCAPGDLGKTVEEWVCLNHDGFAGRKAEGWWREHSTENLNEVAEALELDRVGAAIHIEDRGFVRRPVQITFVREGKFYRVIGRVLGELVRVVEEEIPF